MIEIATIDDLLRTYRKEITLVVITAIVSIVSTKVLPGIFGALRRGGAFLFAVCTGKGKEYRFLRQYLKWVVYETRSMSVIPFQMIDPQELAKLPGLEDVYIRLQLRSSTDEHLELLPANLLKQGTRTVVLGDPGAGKTTYLRYLAFAQATRGLASFLNLRVRRKTRERLGSTRHRVPILIHLNRLYHDGTEFSSELTSVVLATQPDLRRKCPPRFFEKLLKSGTALMLLDGLDEIASADQRMRAMNEIAALANNADSDTSWIITSRIVGYKPKLQEHGFELAVMQPLSDEQVRQFVTNWYQNKCETAGYPSAEIEYERHGHARRAQHLIDALVSNYGLRSLATNPMLVSLITMLHSIRLELPENRAVLYRDCVELLAGRWDLERGVAGHSDGVSATSTQKIAFLTSLAWKMHAEKRREISERELETLLSEHLGRISSNVTAETARTFIDSLLHRSGIIMSRGTSPAGDRLLAFSHLSFQEYLVSRWLQTLTAPEADAFILERHTESWWREAILLDIAQLQFPLEITSRIYERARQTGGLEGLVFAGYCLAEVQADKSHSLFREIAGDLVYIASASQVTAVAVEPLAVDKNNLFIRYLLATVEEIRRLRAPAAELLFLTRFGRAVSAEQLERAMASLTGRSDVGCFDRQFLTAASPFGAPFESLLPLAVTAGMVSSQLLTQWYLQPVDVRLFDSLGWDDLIRLCGRGWNRLIRVSHADAASEWRYRVIAQAPLPRGPCPVKDEDGRVHGNELASVLVQHDLPGAALGIHIALCGIPTNVTAKQLLPALRADDQAERLMAVNALLLREDVSGNRRELIDFVSESGPLMHQERRIRSATPRLDLWRETLVRLALQRLRQVESSSLHSVSFVLACLMSDVPDMKQFGFDMLWRLPSLEPDAIAHVQAGVDAGDLALRWGAVLALANANVEAGLEPELLQSLLAQFYERQFRIRGYSLRDVAGYTLMRLLAIRTAAR